MIIGRAQALAPALMLLAALAAPTATADIGADCALLTRASGQYAKLANELSNLRKTAEEQADDSAALTATQRKAVDLSRTIAGKLHDLQVQLDNPILKYAFATDERSFNDYALTLEGSLNGGDNSATNIHITRAYSRNVNSTEAANDAYHAQCK